MELDGHLEDVEVYCDENGWRYLATEVAEIRAKITATGAQAADWACVSEGCDYVGPMYAPGQTCAPPYVHECPRCGQVDDHELVEDED